MKNMKEKKTLRNKKPKYFLKKTNWIEYNNNNTITKNRNYGSSRKEKKINYWKVKKTTNNNIDDTVIEISYINFY